MKFVDIESEMERGRLLIKEEKRMSKIFTATFLKKMSDEHSRTNVSIPSEHFNTKVLFLNSHIRSKLLLFFMVQNETIE